MNILKTVIVGVGVIVLSGAGGAVGTYYVNRHAYSQSSSSNVASSTTTSNSDVKLASASSSTTIPSLVSKVSPSIVDITSESTSYSYFGGPTTEEGAGTGMIISSDGYILTNNHVLPINSSDITVTLSSGKQYIAQVITTNATKDLAVIKINASALPTVAFGDSSQVAVGDSVIAIGNALGEFQNSVDQGIVSGLNRSIVAGDEGESSNDSESLSGLLQTDAAINPGDSGGPLIDLSTGAVIGMDTATSSEGEGISFAIPVNNIKAFIAPYAASITD
jgi:serine protease Do